MSDTLAPSAPTQRAIVGACRLAVIRQAPHLGLRQLEQTRLCDDGSRNRRSTEFRLLQLVTHRPILRLDVGAQHHLARPASPWSSPAAWRCKRAHDHGELHPDADLAINMAVGAYYAQYLAAEPFAPDWAERVADTILALLAVAP